MTIHIKKKAGLFLSYYVGELNFLEREASLIFFFVCAAGGRGHVAFQRS